MAQSQFREPREIRPFLGSRRGHLPLTASERARERERASQRERQRDRQRNVDRQERARPSIDTGSVTRLPTRSVLGGAPATHLSEMAFAAAAPYCLAVLSRAAASYESEFATMRIGQTYVCLHVASFHTLQSAINSSTISLPTSNPTRVMLPKVSFHQSLHQGGGADVATIRKYFAPADEVAAIDVVLRRSKNSCVLVS